MAHQIGLFCVLQLADRACLEADHNGGYARAATASRPHSVIGIKCGCSAGDHMSARSPLHL